MKITIFQVILINTITGFIYWLGYLLLDEDIRDDSREV